MTEHVNIMNAPEELHAAVSLAKEPGNRVILECDGEQVALVSMEDLELLERLLQEYEDRIDREAVARIEAEPDDSIPYEDFRKELDLD